MSDEYISTHVNVELKGKIKRNQNNAKS